MQNNPMLVFTGTSNPDLTEKICAYLEIEEGQSKIWQFPDGEKNIRLESDVRGRDCFVVQSTSTPVDQNLMELLIYLDCLRRASAARITAVVPYFGYARQDRKDAGRVPITAKLVANLIMSAGADRVLSIDLHAKQLQGFFDIPVDHLTAEPVMVDYLKKKELEDITVVSPDVGNMKLAARYAASLGGELAIIHKRRISGSEVSCGELIGNVEGRNIIMCDDMISTGGTVVSAAKLVKDRGAKNIIVGATHGVFADPACERMQDAPLDEIIVTDTIAMDSLTEKLPNLKVLTISKLFGEAIQRIHKNESVSNMFSSTE